MLGALAGAAVVGAYASWRGSKDIAKAQGQAAAYEKEAADRALAFQKEQYANIKPYLMGSLENYQQLLQNPESVRQQPGYMFRLQEGLKSIGIPEGARNISGAQLKGAMQYGQDYASNEYGNALARIAGLGQLAQGVGGVGERYAANVGNILQGQARSQAQSTLGSAEARASGYQGMAGSISQGLGMYAGMQRPKGGVAGAGGGPTTGYAPYMPMGYGSSQPSFMQGYYMGGM